MNPDAELQLLENDTSAFQNTKQFTVSEVVGDESPYHWSGTPYIKPKIPLFIPLRDFLLIMLRGGDGISDKLVLNLVMSDDNIICYCSKI